MNQLNANSQTTSVPTDLSRIERKTAYDLAKRLVDVTGALVLIVLTSPLWAIAALIIYCSDGGSVMLGQWRLRRGHQLFRMYKFRTMYKDAERGKGAVCAKRNDPRIIPACRWMRRAHIDELPQLWNVLLGDMSLVGPRPERPEIAHKLFKEIDDFAVRTTVKPGLTGLAQVAQGYANDVDGFRVKLRHDLDYVEKRSIFMDLRLLLATARKLWDAKAC